MLLPADDQFTVLADKLAGADARVRRVRYLVEDEVIAAGQDRLTAVSRACRLNRPYRGTFTEVTGGAATAATDAFEVMWDAHSAAAGPAFRQRGGGYARRTGLAVLSGRRARRGTGYPARGSRILPGVRAGRDRQ